MNKKITYKVMKIDGVGFGVFRVANSGVSLVQIVKTNAEAERIVSQCVSKEILK